MTMSGHTFGLLLALEGRKVNMSIHNRNVAIALLGVLMDPQISRV